ncbi:G-type lectin S-receptor-like serine/threonine-protein kinase LECRK3 [Populus alba x Populus x berolinensis]|uniref:non-specific serine/threonine protein kinase n=1 Tax=Populus alba x Populus x berolinensis TaxID=444605 RepID=A0AAD6QTF7_9ROSI|nr:G-type lectin S-receptor-like serine/threonine-protein kinase LECRK3 [Populus alba x Populus x berolinensis]
MASIIFFLLLALSFTASAQRQTNITLGSSLTPFTNSLWLSPSGLYAFGFFRQRDGYSIGVFLSGISLKTVVWAARRDDAPVPSNATLLFTSDGRVVLRSAQGDETPIVSASQPASLASMSDSGNFVLYNSDHEIIWQSFDHPTDTLLPTQQLRAGAELVSPVSETHLSTGIYRLKMQHDGHLVQYPVSTPDTAPYAYFASGTNGAGDNVTLNLDPDGRLYLLNSTGFNIKNITAGGYPTKETINMMKLDADGIFRLYSQNLTRNGNWSAVWSSTSDKCQPKGSCGLNGYCVVKDQEAECICLPGFKFVTQGNWTSGCQRDFNAESCNDKNGSSTYTMEELSNTIWEDVSYSVLSLTMKDNCKQACLEDCNCEAALFTDGQYCRKQRLPLRFGRRNLESSNLAVVKVGRPISSMDRKEKKNLGTGRRIVIISCSVVAFGLAIVAIFGIIIYRYHVLAYKKVPKNDGTALNEEFAPRAFTYAELEDVTGGFKEEIGRGSFGTVYKGIISSTRKVVAVKRLEKALAEGEREFQNEMKVIGKTHHRNLARLLGYCHDEHHRLLDGDMDKLVGDEIVEKKQLDRMVKVGLWCTLDEPSLRPSMKKAIPCLNANVHSFAQAQLQGIIGESKSNTTVGDSTLLQAAIKLTNCQK